MSVQQKNDPPESRGESNPVTTLAITGMTCGNCARHVTEAIQRVPSVRSATVSLEASQATVRWLASLPSDVGSVMKSVEAEGYGAKVLDGPAIGEGASKLAGWRVNLGLGVPVTIILMLGEWAFGLGMTPWYQWLAFGLAGLVQVFSGARFYVGAWNQLKSGNSNMDTLVALGSTTAFGYSVWALLSGQGGHLYFMEAAAIITLISVGHWSESLMSARASSALRQLLHLAPAMARRRKADGTEIEVPVADLRVKDLVVLRPGDRVPTDGEVVEGGSVVDESMLTGESVPVDKAAGQLVYAGTLNVSGRLLARITATGEETALAHIIVAVQRAQTSRAAIQRLGDRVSNVFVPVVVSIAVLAGLWWGLAPASAQLVHNWLAQFLWHVHTPAGPLAAAFIIAAGVLIVACPCAMGLATPAAIMAGSNAAAQRGILVRDGIALEKAGKVTAVMFDKTGTLTVGKPSVVEVWYGGASRDQESESQGQISNQPKSKLDHEKTTGIGLESSKPETWALDLAVALARHSSHPVSGAVSNYSPWNNDFEIAGWEEIHGAGVQGRIRRGPGFVPQDSAKTGAPVALSSKGDVNAECLYAPAPVPDTLTRRSDSSQGSGGPWARLGSAAWLERSGIDLAPGAQFIASRAGQGATLAGLALEQRLIALFAIKDTIKPGAAEVVSRLRDQGLRVYMITGDNAVTAASIAQQLTIAPENVFAEVRPEQKAQFVKQRQQQGEKVAFVGDGINDAPALEQADLGIAVSRASDVAREAADIILLKSEIQAVPESLSLAHATLRTIKQNLFWAFFYNAMGVPLAALGFLSPILCAAAMGLSDLVVIGNALRLSRWSS